MKRDAASLPTLIDFCHARHGREFTHQCVGQQFAAVGHICHLHGVIDIRDDRYTEWLNDLNPSTGAGRVLAICRLRFKRIRIVWNRVVTNPATLRTRGR